MRLFLALALPDELRSAVASAADTLRLAPREWRRVRDEGLHLTLRFLGDVEESTRVALDTRARSAVQPFPPLPLRVGGFGSFPSHGRPRVAWVGVEDRSPDGALTRLAAGLERAARESGLTPENRPFSPHVTIARAREGARPAPVTGGPPDPVGEFVASQVILYRSDLGPGGSRYAPVSAYPFAGTATR